DNAQERFRSRFITSTFGGVLPPMFDPRFYAVRDGAAHTVTSPIYELVDDQQVLRMGWRHRLQTKTGPAERPRMKDWMTLDLEASYFPREDRDNFGEPFGLITSRYAWNVGDRTTILASSLHDLFLDGQDIWNVGVLSQRSTRGSVYVGVRQIAGGPVNSQILTANYSYRMSEKWVSTLGTAYDLGESMNRGQSMTLTRIGADFLIHVGANYDQSKDNFGVGISIEPRFGPFQSSSNQLSSLLGTN
ncbi:MAG: organic solvent tolerance protein OstA, partial [Planctomycetaceae bacterium]